MTNRQKQNLLQYLGYYTGIPDDIWGPMSQQATEAFQRAYGLTVDGVFGVGTEQRILEVIATGEQPAQQPQTSPETDGGEDWWKDIRYFRRDEPGIACPCGHCGGFPVEPTEKLMRLADRVRDQAGAPAIPSSTVRCAAHNAELKGSAPNSRHLSGKAMDFCIRGWGSAKTLALVQQQPDVCYAYVIDDSFVHMDVD